MVKRIIVFAYIFLCYFANLVYAEMITKILTLKEGQSVDLVEEVEWPVVAAWADFDRPVKIGPVMTVKLSFQQEFKDGIIYGPITITLRYGNPMPDTAVATDGGDISTPDAIQ